MYNEFIYRPIKIIDALNTNDLVNFEQSHKSVVVAYLMSNCFVALAV